MPVVGVHHIRAIDTLTPADPYSQPERKSEELDNLRVTHGRLPVIL